MVYGLKKITIVQFLYNTLYKEDLIKWTKKQILDYIKFNGLFTSFKFNRISGLLPDLFN